MVTERENNTSKKRFGKGFNSKTGQEPEKSMLRRVMKPVPSI